MPDPRADRDAAELADDLGHSPTGDQVVDDGRARLLHQLTGRDQRGQRRRRDGAAPLVDDEAAVRVRSEEHTSELQSLMRISYAVFCLKKKTTNIASHMTTTT